jgi:hypothetical protein
MPLTVVRVKETGHTAIYDRDTRRYWIGHGFDRHYLLPSEVEPLPLGKVPAQYGKWVTTSIGGLSTTKRLQGIYRGALRTSDATLYAAHPSSEQAVRMCLNGVHGVTIGDTKYDSELGYVTLLEVTVPEYHLALVCARIARAGATPHLVDHETKDAGRSLGVERLDRITSDCTVDHERMYAEEDGVYGVRRGLENWEFSWLPEDWKRAPLTWDHLVGNVAHVPIHKLPKPLQQHAAKVELERTEDPERAAFLRRYVGLERVVSAALSPMQSEQLITAFYLLSVEESEMYCEVAKAILHRYMVERGYTARWTGRYVQGGRFIGNSDRFRRFNMSLPQYDIERLPTQVLNKICDERGQRKVRGSKGSRSKYKQRGERGERYVPKKRLKRSAEDERSLVKDVGENEDEDQEDWEAC